MRFHLILASALLALATPALAQNGATVSEPSDLALLGLGVIGVIVGRHVASKRK